MAKFTFKSNEFLPEELKRFAKAFPNAKPNNFTITSDARTAAENVLLDQARNLHFTSGRGMVDCIAHVFALRENAELALLSRGLVQVGRSADVEIGEDE